MTGTHSYYSQVEHDKCSTATRSPLPTLDATSQSLQPVSSSCVSGPNSDTGDLHIYTRQESRLLFRKVEELHNNQCEAVWRLKSSHPDIQTLEAEAKMEVLRVAEHAFSDVFNFIPYVDESIGEGSPRRQDENGEQLGERFGRVYLNARMGMYTAKKIYKDGPSHKAASRWRDALEGIEENVVHPTEYIKLVSRYSHSFRVLSLELTL
jgi:hypothetical protein